MLVKIRKLWGAGIASVSTPFVDRAIRLGEGLEIECNGAIRSISFDDLITKKPRKSTFDDKFGRTREYSLYDFYWNDLK